MSSNFRVLSELLRKEGEVLFTLLTRVVLREDVAEDLMQEIFIKLSRVKGLEKVANLAAYARKVALNLAFEWRKGHGNQTVRLDDAAEPACDCRSPLTDLIYIEELDRLLNAISQLSGISRQAFVMRYIEQQPYEVIAAELGKTPHQVRALCYKALSHLQYIFGEQQNQFQERNICDAKN